MVNALIITLETDTREDDVQSLMRAIEQMRGVLSVSGNVADINDHIAFRRVRREMVNKLIAVLDLDGDR